MDCTPTIRPSGSFNPERIAAKMQKAIKGIGTDERAIIDVVIQLTSHTNSQRQDIKSRYKTMYGRDLVEDLKKDLGGSFEDTCLALLIPQYEYLADCLYNSVKKGLNVGCIIDILTTHNNWDMKEIKQKFSESIQTSVKSLYLQHVEYNENLESFICNQFSGDFQRVLRSLINANREESNRVDQQISEKEAKALYEAGVKIMGTEEDDFLRILCNYSFDQLQDIFKHYNRLTGHTMETAIAKEFSGQLLDIFSAIVSSVNSVSTYYAVRLHECIHGVGTDDETLIRILVCRSEIDLEDIKDVYKKKFVRKITDDITNDTSGDYQKLLIKILSPL